MGDVCVLGHILNEWITAVRTHEEDRMDGRPGDAARCRFLADQDDAEYVEYTEAMARIGSRRRWRRERRRFLEARALPVGNALDNELRSLLTGD